MIFLKNMKNLGQAGPALAARQLAAGNMGPGKKKWPVNPGRAELVNIAPGRKVLAAGDGFDKWGL